MSRWASVELSPNDWTMRSSLPKGIWQVSAGTISDHAVTIESLRATKAADLWVTPECIDPATGAITTTQRGRGRMGSRLGAGLAEGDVLVPVGSDHPCVLVSQAHRALLFSPRFHTLRAQELAPLALWAALSSSTGVASRLALESDAMSHSTAQSLLPLALPLIPKHTLARLRNELPQPAIHATALFRERSAWAIVQLTKPRDWWQPDKLMPPIASRTVQLGKVADIWTGSVRKRDLMAVPALEAVQVITARDIRTEREPAQWARVPAATTLTDNTTIVLPTTGRLQATLPRPGSALSRDLMAVNIQHGNEHVPEDAAQRLVAYFNSAAGAAVLERATRGNKALRLTAAGLRALHIPEPLDLPTTHPADPILAERLQRILEAL